MPNRLAVRVLLSAALAALAVGVLATRVFVDINLVRVPVFVDAAPASAGVVRAKAAESSRANTLQAPFAVTLRLSQPSSAAASFSLIVDGVPVCSRDVAGAGSRRIDCAVVSGWRQAGDHEIVVQGPASNWTVASIELSTHHGRNNAPNELVVLPAGSGHYDRPAAVWVMTTWLVLTVGLALLPAAPAMPRALVIVYRLIAGFAVAELAISAISPWVSNYRVVLSAWTFAGLLVVLLLPRLWYLARAIAAAAGRRPVWAVGVAVVLLALVAAGVWRSSPYWTRARLLSELQPTALTNCEFKRFGEANDGGYVLCANLLGSVQSAYSYGISGYDQWGCDISRRLSVAVHEYDCFDLRAPSCPGGRAIFHPECVGPEPATIEGRLFDAPDRQFEKNGDAGKHVVVKMDVESAEWDTLAHASDATLDRIDQLAIELHGVDRPDRNLAVIRRLKRFFYVASLHFNNFSCQDDIAPFPAWAYEVLFVNRRIGIAGGSGPAGAPPSQLAPNDQGHADCQHR